MLNKISIKNKLNKKEASIIFAKLQKLWPNARCELEYNNPFQLLIAVVLSAQTTDKSVNRALAPIFKEYPKFSPDNLKEMGLDKFYIAIKSIGLAPTKSKNCLKISGILINKYSGNVPLNREDLETLPGVGRKTASVILNVLCGLATMPVDTHVERVTKRLGFAPNHANRLEVEKILLNLIPQEYAVQAHHLLIFHGRYHCTARSPKCENCSLIKECLFYQLNFV